MADTTPTRIFVQGNNQNQWLNSQKWQKEFLGEDVHNLTKSFFRTNGKHSYMNLPITTIDKIPCENLKKVAEEVGITTIDKYAVATSWYEWMYTWRSSTNPVKAIGFICNLSTGMCRMYFETTDSTIDFPHSGPVTMDSENLEKYREAFHNEAISLD